MKLLNFSTFCLLILLVQATNPQIENQEGSDAQEELGRRNLDSEVDTLEGHFEKMNLNETANVKKVPESIYYDKGKIAGTKLQAKCISDERQVKTCCTDKCEEEKLLLESGQQAGFKNFLRGCNEYCNVSLPVNEFINQCGDDGATCGTGLKKMCNSQQVMEQPDCCAAHCYTGAVAVWNDAETEGKQIQDTKFNEFYYDCMPACNPQRVARHRQRRA